MYNFISWMYVLMLFFFMNDVMFGFDFLKINCDIKLKFMFINGYFFIGCKLIFFFGNKDL